MGRESGKSIIFGVGLNDTDLRIRHKLESGKYQTAHFYRAWLEMLRRCYSPEWHARQPTYIGSTVCSKWLYLSGFLKWYREQDVQAGMELDKDLLSPGNTVYSPETCIFIPRSLNRFAHELSKSRRGLPTGVGVNRNGSFIARCHNPFTMKRERLGSFATEKDAHSAWLNRKHELACMWAEEVSDPRLKQALRTRYI